MQEKEANCRDVRKIKSRDPWVRLPPKISHFQARFISTLLKAGYVLMGSLSINKKFQSSALRRKSIHSQINNLKL
jgi:hypothetical protein